MGAVLLLGLAQTGSGADVLRSLGVRSDANGFTELSYAQPTTLPVRTVRREQVSVPFIVHNVETAPRAYAWEVVRRGSGGEAVLAHGTTKRLRAGEAAYVPARFMVPCERAVSDIAMRLVGVKQTIDFVTHCPTGGSADGG